MRFLISKFIDEWRTNMQQQRLKIFVKSKGWKIVRTFFVFYAICDSILYVIIPNFAFTSLSGC